MFPPPNGIEMFAEFYLRMGVSQMKMNRWFSVALLVGVSAMSNESLVSTYADDTAKPGHSHEPAKSDEAKIKAAIAKLPEADRSAAAGQRYCPMMDTVRLGAMGAPVKVMIDGKPVFLCCEGCKDEAVEHGKETLTKVEKLKKAAIAVAKPLAEAQLYCPIVKDSRLGSMGMPVKLMLDGKPVFLCCKGCEDDAKKNAKATLAKVEGIKKANAKSAHHDHEDHDHKKDDAPKK
jgi:hypothetical protein